MDVGPRAKNIILGGKFKMSNQNGANVNKDTLMLLLGNALAPQGTLSFETCSDTL